MHESNVSSAQSRRESSKNPDAHGKKTDGSEAGHDPDEDHVSVAVAIRLSPTDNLRIFLNSSLPIRVCIAIERRNNG